MVLFLSQTIVVTFTLLLLSKGSAWALNDIPVYYDAREEDRDGCERMGVQDSDWTFDVRVAKVTSSLFDAINLNDMSKSVSTEMIPINCEDFFRGTDAIELEVSEDVGEGGDYHLQMKFANNRSYALTGYKDIRFRVKNLGSEDEVIGMELVKDFPFPMHVGIAVPAGADWDEIVVPLEEFAVLDWRGEKTDVFNENDMFVGVGLAYTKNSKGSALHLLFDDIRLTDGSGLPILATPDVVGGEVPDLWPDYLVTGYLDTRGKWDEYDDFDTDTDYRYQYVMPETFVSWGENFVEEYVDISDDIGFKTSMVWYNFGKVSESEVAYNLSDASFMSDYFSRYDEMLNQMAKGGSQQKDYLIVLEPDLYGKLMQDGHLPGMDATEVLVVMDKANEISGKNYAGNMKGWAEYLVERAHEKLDDKGVMLGHMLNHWGYGIPGQIGQGRIESHVMSGYAQGDFLSSLGDVGKGDVVFVEKSDRDAGNPEKVKQDWFWTDDNYDIYFSWVRCLSVRSGLRVVGWQISEGNMEHPVPEHRDDAVQYFVDNPEKWVKAGFIGVLFGAGLPGNANYPKSAGKVEENDDGWFSQTMKQYMSTPLKFSEVDFLVNTNPESSSSDLPDEFSSSSTQNESVESSVIESSDESVGEESSDGDALSSEVLSSAENTSPLDGRIDVMVSVEFGMIHIQGVTEVGNVTLFELSGKKVHSENFTTQVFQLPTMPRGVYFYQLKLIDAHQTFVGSFVMW